jgi:hypothetical protein
MGNVYEIGWMPVQNDAKIDFFANRFYKNNECSSLFY